MCSISALHVRLAQRIGPWRAVAMAFLAHVLRWYRMPRSTQLRTHNCGPCHITICSVNCPLILLWKHRTEREMKAGSVTTGLLRLLAVTAALALGAAGTATDVAPVNVTLYAEALCPYCASFLAETLAPLLDNGFDNVIDFRYVAWGNARRDEVRASACAACCGFSHLAKRSHTRHRCCRTVLWHASMVPPSAVSTESSAAPHTSSLIGQCGCRSCCAWRLLRPQTGKRQWTAALPGRESMQQTCTVALRASRAGRLKRRQRQRLQT